jgi:Arc/MetJ-type ribon-helix-helix transcriptional regulator
MQPTDRSQEMETVSIKIPSSLMERIRARVRTGEFQSEDAAVIHAVQEQELWSQLPAEPLGSFDEMLAGIPDLLERLDRGEEKTLSVDDVRKDLAAHRRDFQNA